jgi:hypothetical protein
VRGLLFVAPPAWQSAVAARAPEETASLRHAGDSIRQKVPILSLVVIMEQWSFDWQTLPLDPAYIPKLRLSF